MSKVIMFSRVFPAYHPKKGEPTFFVEKLLISRQGKDICSQNFGFDADKFEPKHHTIRSGHRFKVRDYFSPRVWSDKPYRSKQIIIAPDIKIEKVFDFKITKYGYFVNKRQIGFYELPELAKNDGLEVDDFECWFNFSTFDGQIICWNKEINY